MKRNSLKSKRDMYEIHEATVTRYEDSLRINMSLNHCETKVQTAGTLILNIQDSRRLFRQD